MERIFNQMIRFSIVGGLSTGVDFLLLTLLTEFMGIPYYISNIFSFFISLFVNYFLSMRYVFTKRNNYSQIKKFISFFALSVVGLIINQVILVLLTQFGDMYYIYSKVIATVIVMIWNFISKKIFFEYSGNK